MYFFTDTCVGTVGIVKIALLIAYIQRVTDGLVVQVSGFEKRKKDINGVPTL